MTPSAGLNPAGPAVTCSPSVLPILARCEVRPTRPSPAAASRGGAGVRRGRRDGERGGDPQHRHREQRLVQADRGGDEADE